MATNKLQDIVIKEIKDYLLNQDQDVTINSRLEDLGVDSLGAITIMYELEDKLGFSIPNDSLESLITVEDIINELERLSDLES